MEKLLSLALEEKWDDVLAILKTESPVKTDKFLKEFFNVRKDAFYPYEKWNEEQKAAFREIDSPEYRINYYLSKNEEELTDDELADLRACDF